MIQRFLTALRFLTIIPVPGGQILSDEDMGRSMALFPLIGLLIGLFLAGGRYVLGMIFPAPLADILVIAVLVVVTGALHLDGVADTIDGLVGGTDRERTLAIMRDSRIGSFGVVGLVIILMLKVVALIEIPDGMKGRALMLMPVLGRWSAVQLAAWLDYARMGEGTGRAFARSTGRGESIISTGIAAVIAAGIFGIEGMVMFLGIAVLTLCLGLFFRRRIGGVTGDVMGAACEMNEVAALILICAFFM